MANYYIVVDATPETLFYEGGWENDGATGVTFISRGAETMSTALKTFLKKVNGTTHVIRIATGAPDVSGVTSTSTLASYLTSNYSGLTWDILE